jgi:hypothetical protein
MAKLTIEGCNTPNEESNEIKKRALPYVAKQRAYEKKVKHVKVMIHNGYLLVPEAKYLKNKEYYNNLKISKQ